MRAKSNQVREGTVEGLKEDENGKRSACFAVIKFQLIFGHPYFLG